MLIRHIEGLEISQGQGVGERVRLFPWERRFLRGAFEPDLSTAALSVARGNGKSTLLGAVDRLSPVFAGYDSAPDQTLSCCFKSSPWDSVKEREGAHEPSAAPRSRSNCSALVCKFVSPAFPASSSAISKSFRASSLRFNSTFAMPRLI